MAASIAALTAGGGGLQSTSDASGNLNLVSGTTTIVAMTSAGIAVTGTLTASGAVTLTTVLPVASGGTGVATSTGTGAVVLGTSPTLATPTFNSAQLATVVGTAPLYMCRAWVNFNGTGTVAIRASGNVSSITDNGTGYYTMNFTTAMTDANYVCTFASYGRQAGGSYNGTYELGYYSSSTLAGASKGTTSVLLGGCWGALNSFAQEDIEMFEVAVFR